MSHAVGRGLHLQVEKRQPSVKDVNGETRVKRLFHRLHLAEGVPRRIVSGCMLFLSPLLNIHEMRSGQRKANPGVAGIAVAVQESHFPQCFESSSFVKDYT